MLNKTTWQKGDIAALKGEDNIFLVEITDIFDDDGITYASVKPIEFDSFEREVEISRLIHEEDL